LASVGNEDLILVHYDATGSPLAARRLGGAGTRVEGRSLALDSAGHVFAAGTSDDTNGWVDAFDPDLTTRWSVNVADPMNPSTVDAAALTVDPATNDVVVCGGWSGTIDFGGGPRTSTSSSMWSDLFVLTLDGNGAYVADVDLGPNASCRQVMASAGVLAVTGTFRAPTTLGGSPLTPAGVADGFALTTYAAITTFGDTGAIATAVGYTLDGYLAGEFHGTIQVGGSMLIGSDGAAASFVGRLEGSGAAWTHELSATADMSAYALAVSPAAVVVVGGLYGETTSFDMPAMSAGGSDAFIAAYAR
jgi:hypothetical protein